MLATTFRGGCICNSLTARTSIFGCTLFNTAFETLNIDWLHKPFQVDSKELEDAVRGVRGLSIRGCGVSMPHKEAVLPHLDIVDDQAQEIGAVNTVVNENGVLHGYNTGYSAAKSVLSALRGTLLIVGIGGVARAITVAAKELQLSVTVTGRDARKALALAARYDIPTLPWQQRDRFTADTLINATPVGMSPDTGMIVRGRALDNFSVVADLVINPARTPLLRAAVRHGRQTIAGAAFALQQALEQFRLYTQKEPPTSVMERALRSLLEEE